MKKAKEDSAKLGEAPWGEADVEGHLKGAIRKFVLASPDNRLQAIDGEPIFEEPL
ncbi:MAG: hypothetical protein GWO44_20675, partial [Thermoplasmata archaeon]|nr:hypothetical protein [Thermoplasmata archaeon]NIY05606.1 hypothetical protein [Thermoplasmata archaeon]